MKARIFTTLLLGGLLAAQVSSLHAQDARFFRILGPVPTTITDVTADGTVTWTNVETNATFTVQTATALPDATNWVDWVQVPVTNAVTVHRIFDPTPPPGMAFIPAGSFTMGDTFSEGSGSERPTHTVYVSAFYMDKYEVTKALWDTVKAYNGGNGYSYENAGSGEASTHPVQTVNWRDCVKWCNARSQREGLTPCYYNEAGLMTVYKTGTETPYPKWNANGYRLPTEAEWEKAARGGASGKRFPWRDSDTIQHSRANYYSSSLYAYDTSLTRGYHPTFDTGDFPYTSPVGYFGANGYGLCDMAGNVWECCWDWYQSDWYSQAGATQSDTRGPTGPLSNRVWRGGDWRNVASYTRCATRVSSNPGSAYGNHGFRCVRGL